MQKTIWIFIPLFILMVMSPVSAMSSEILIGSDGQGLVTGIELATSKRKMLGFLGYQEDYSKGMLGLNTSTQKPVGFLQGGRNVFVGNIKYHVSAYVGNANRQELFVSKNKVALAGDVLKIEGVHGYGIKGEVNLIGDPRFSIAPYYEWRGQRVYQAMIGIGSHDPFLQLKYLTSVGKPTALGLYAKISSLGPDYGVQLALNEDLSITGNYTGYLGLGLQWSPTDNPFGFSLNWCPAGIQWISSYRF